MRLLKTISAAALLLPAFIAQATALPPGFTIKAKFTGLKEGSKIYLVPAATHADEKPVDSAVVTNGAFSFKGSVPGPRLFYVQLKDVFGIYSLMVENTNISIQGKAVETGRGDQTYYNFTDVKVTGSPSHDLFQKKMSVRAELDEEYNAYNERGKEISQKIGAAREAKDTALMATLEKSEAYKKYEAEESAFFKSVETKYQKALTENKDSFWGPLLMLNFWNYFRPEDSVRFNQFSKAAQQSYYGKILREQILPEGFKGKMAPFISMKDAAGTKADSTKVIGAAKYVLVDFWASWCKPCRMKIPALKKLYETYHSKGFEIVSISIDKKEPDWHKALGEEKLAWPNYLDLGETANAWKVRAIPAVFMLDASGKVIMENMSEEDMENLLKTL